MKKNYDHDKAAQEEAGKSQCQPENTTFESRDGIMAVLKKLLGNDKTQSDLADLSEFAWP